MRLPALLVLALLAAGCLQQGVTPASTVEPSLPTYDVTRTVLERLELKVSDGTTLVLAANMSEEARDAGLKMPVIVDIGPYFSTGILTYTAIDQRLAEYFVPRGYVVARASLRGTGESGGCFDLGGKTEQQDVKDIVEFLASQEWSNGNVAVFGKSYDGTTPWMAALTHAKGLRTIVPISGITDMYRYTFYDGVAYPEELLFEPYYYLYVGEDASIPGPDGGDPAWTGNAKTLQQSIHPCQSTAFADQTRADVQSTVTGDHGDAFWLERDYELRWSEVDVPVFMVHGLQDWNVKPDHQVPMYDALDVPKAAWLGQWGHDYPDVNRFNPDWSRHDWNETLLVWFDHWLKDKDNDWEEVAHVEVQDQLGDWRTDATWPPRDAVTLDLALTSDGAVATAPGEAAVQSFRDPLAKGYDGKANGLGFVSAPMPADVTLTGRPSLDIKLHVDQPGGHLAVALYDVDENGAWTQLDHGARNLWHRDTREKGTPVTPGAAFNTTVWLYPQELTLAKGHRLGVSIAATDPEWFVRSPFAPTYAVHLGDGGSTLRLTVRGDDADALRDAMAASDGGTTPGGALPTLAAWVESTR